jgi:hypothetical protein
MRKNANGKSYHSEPSDYLEGKTILSTKQLELLHEIAWIVYHEREHFDNLLQNYAPLGLIKILRDQVYARFTNESISQAEQYDALTLIDKLSNCLKSGNE